MTITAHRLVPPALQAAALTDPATLSRHALDAALDIPEPRDFTLVRARDTGDVVEALLGAFELRVGRYSSPHVQSVTERISLDGEPISASRVRAALEAGDEETVARLVPAPTLAHLRSQFFSDRQEQ